MSPPLRQPAVSDHALLRYLERVYRLDLDDIRARMLTPLTADAIRAGATAVVIEGVRFMVAGDGTITTVMTGKPWNRKKVRKTFRPRGAGKETPTDDTQERLREHEDETEEQE